IMPSGSLPDEAIGSEMAVGTVESMARGGVAGPYAMVLVDQVGTAATLDEVEPFPVWVRFPEGERVVKGSRVELGWSLSPLVEVSPGYADYVRAQGASATAYASWVDVIEEGNAFYRGLERLRSRVTNGLMSV